MAGRRVGGAIGARWTALIGGLMGCGPGVSLAPASPLPPVVGRSLHAAVRVDGSLEGLRLQASIDGRGVAVVARSGGEFALAADTLSMGEGGHELVWRATRGVREVAALSQPFSVDLTPPVGRVDARGLDARQGEAHAVVVRFSELLAAPPKVWLAGTERVVLPVGEGAWRLVTGFPVTHIPGDVPLEVQAFDGVGNGARATWQIHVHEREFPDGGFIQLSGRQTRARKNQAAIDKQKAERAAAYGWPLAEPQWHGGLLRPVEGRRSSAFGKARRYSDGRVSHHLGTDIANVPGTPVRAAAAGQVAHVGYQVLFGNVVIVHHGQGVASSYNHLLDTAVLRGEHVAAGQRLGSLGSTGQSTGPHLHWGLEADGHAVDPEAWPEDGFAPSASDRQVSPELVGAPTR